MTSPTRISTPAAPLPLPSLLSTSLLSTSLLLAILPLAGCGAEGPPDPHVTDVRPRFASGSSETPITISGRNFLSTARLALDAKSPVSVNAHWRVSLGDDPLPEESTTLLDDETLLAVVPPNLDAGSRPLTVTGPTGKQATFEPGLTVLGDAVPSSGGVPPDGCSASCGALAALPDTNGACCEQSCPLGDCPNCPPGAECFLGCESATTCSAECQPGSTCWLDSINTGGAALSCDSSSCDFECANDSGCEIDCRGSSTCALHCTETNGCTMTCDDAASCLLQCERTSTCDVFCDNPVDCGGDIKVCNRPCP